MRWWESGEGGFEDNDHDECLDAKVKVKTKDHRYQWYPATLQWGGRVPDFLWILSRGAYRSPLYGLAYPLSGTRLVPTDSHSSDDGAA